MKKVLVVDDETVIREVVRDVLLDEGYDVYVASNGHEALSLVAEVRPDAVLMDIMMPGLDGWGARQAIRSYPELASIPIILTSAAASPEVLDSGIDAFLPKPFDVDELIAVVQRAVAG